MLITKLNRLLPAALLLLAALTILFLLNIQRFLSLNRSMDAEVLIVEGFLPDHALAMAVDEYNRGNYLFVITTGIPLTAEYRMPFAGRILFELPDSLCGVQEAGPEITVRLFGTALEGEYARFRVLVNGAMVGEAVSQAISREYRFLPDSATGCVRELAIEFFNDAARAGEDRDLFLEQVGIGALQLPARSPYSRYQRGLKPGGPVFETMLLSLAEVAADQLTRMGLPESCVVPVATSGRIVNRTRASAMAVRQRMDEGNIRFESANVLSLGAHARRSWILYHRQFKGRARVGIISIPDERYDPANWWKSEEGRRRVVTEGIKYLYTLFFLW
jgi:hypothetical protein